jgi:ribosomal protein L14
MLPAGCPCWGDVSGFLSGGDVDSTRVLMTRPHYTHYFARDNGGIRAAYSINRTLLLGEFARVTASVTRVGPAGGTRRGDLVGLVVFGAARRLRRRTGTGVHLGYNGVIATRKDGAPTATRVYGPVYLEARHAGYARLAVVAKGVL